MVACVTCCKRKKTKSVPCWHAKKHFSYCQKEMPLLNLKLYLLPTILRMSREDGTMQIVSSYKVRIAESNQKIARAFERPLISSLRSS